MTRRYPLPTLWLLTDERQGDALWSALATLPRNAAVVVRHYSLPTDARKRLFERIRRIARKRGLRVLLAGHPATARAWKADGVYGTARAAPRQLHAFPAHDVPEIRAGEGMGADLLLLSPLYPTRTHPGAPALGRVRFAKLARQAQRPVIALGGVTSRNARGLRRLGAVGWAGIDAFGRR